MNNFVFSKLNKTWIFDLDGTLVTHNGYKENNEKLLDGVKDFFKQIPNDDFVLILTSRSSSLKEDTENFLKKENIKYNQIIYDLPHGERILVNDRKPSGLKTAYAVNKNRDEPLNISYIEDNSL